MSSCWYLQFQSRSNENIFAFPSLEYNSVPQQWDTFLYPLRICSFVETWNTQKVVKRKPTNLSSIISLQFFLHLKFTYIQMHKYKLYNLMRCNKRIHLLNHIPVKTWNISITPESSPCPFSVTRGNHFSDFFFFQTRFILPAWMESFVSLLFCLASFAQHGICEIHTVCTLLCKASFIQHNAFENYPCCYINH